MKFVYDDGGRASSGTFRGKHTHDCVTRSIAIITQLPYFEIYQALRSLAKRHERHGKHKKEISSPRTGVYKATTKRYLKSLGYTFVPLMTIGSGCRYHLRESELPTGRLIVSLSRHYTAVIDHVIHDTYDPSRDGSRCVYGYWHLPAFTSAQAAERASVAELPAAPRLPYFSLPQNLVLSRFSRRV